MDNETIVMNFSSEQEVQRRVLRQEITSAFVDGVIEAGQRQIIEQRRLMREPCYAPQVD